MESLDPLTFSKLEDTILQLTFAAAVGSFSSLKFEWNRTYNPDVYFIHHLSLVHRFQIESPVLKQSGDRISLDKPDAPSFQVKLRPLTPNNWEISYSSSIYRQNIDQTEASGQDIRIMNAAWTPTGFYSCVDTVPIRPLIVAGGCLFCKLEFYADCLGYPDPKRKTFHVNYPIPWRPHNEIG